MSPRPTQSLHGLRILLAEDHVLLADFIQEILRSLDCTVIGPVGTLEAALRAIDTHAIDGGLLDVTLGAHSIYPAARELAARSIPFIMMTGHTNLDAFPALLGGAPRLVKPFRLQQMEDMMARTFRARNPAETGRH